VKREEDVGAFAVSMIACCLRLMAHAGVCAEISLEHFFAMPMSYHISTILLQSFRWFCHLRLKACDKAEQHFLLALH